MTEATHEFCGHGVVGLFLFFLSLFNAYEPVACLGKDMPPPLRQTCQQSGFEHPYAIALRGNIYLGSRQEREKRSRLPVRRQRKQGARGKRDW
jgi:hypothetical protein